MLENDTEDASTTNYEHGHVSSKYIERFTNPSLHTGASKINSRNNSINGLEIEIKEEKADNEVVSFKINEKKKYLNMYQVIFLPRVFITNHT